MEPFQKVVKAEVAKFVIDINKEESVMEKHIEIFSKQNPNMDIKCPNCDTKIKIKTRDFLKIKYKFNAYCPICNHEFVYDTTDFHKELEKLKRFV